MNWSNWERSLWWFLLVLLFTTFVIWRLPVYLGGGKSTTVDAIVLVVYIALLLAPLFQEVSLFGVSLKNKIDEVKAEVDTLKAEFRNSVTVNITNQQPESHLSEVNQASEKMQQSRPIVQRVISTEVLEDLTQRRKEFLVLLGGLRDNPLQTTWALKKRAIDRLNKLSGQNNLDYEYVIEGLSDKAKQMAGPLFLIFHELDVFTDHLNTPDIHGHFPMPSNVFTLQPLLELEIALEQVELAYIYSDLEDNSKSTGEE